MTRERVVTLSQVPVALMALYECVKSSGADRRDVCALKSALRQSLIYRFGDAEAAERAENGVFLRGDTASEQRHHERMIQLVETCGGLHDAVFAASFLDPRTMLLFRSGLCRNTARVRAISFIAHLHRVFLGAPAAVDYAAVLPGPAGDADCSDSSSSISSCDSVVERARDIGSATTVDAATVSHDEWVKRLKNVADGAYTARREFFPQWVQQQDGSSGRAFTLADMAIEDVEPFRNPVQFWAEREDVPPFAEMYEMAMAVLCIPATEAAAERTFKQSKRIRSAERTRLCTELTDALVVAGRGFRALGVRNLDEYMRWQCER